MKFKILKYTREGFTSGLAIKLSNGLVLRTPDMTWLCKEENAKINQQFNEFVDYLNTVEVKAISPVAH